jgi:hypothetical protein
MMHAFRSMDSAVRLKVAWHVRIRTTLVAPCLQRTDVPVSLSTNSVTAERFEEEEYEATAQASQRRAWAASVRSATGRVHHAAWAPDTLDPPLALQDVAVVLVGPKKPLSCGTVARACSCFECGDLRIVAPRCGHNTRHGSIFRAPPPGVEWGRGGGGTGRQPLPWASLRFAHLTADAAMKLLLQHSLRLRCPDP